MIIFTSPLLIKIFTRDFASAITLFPFIILKHGKLKSDVTLINHEKIHIRQQLELLIIFFYLQYLLEYLYFRIKGLNHDTAYRYISFEREAYQNELNLNYLKTRKPYSWRNCIKRA